MIVDAAQRRRISSSQSQPEQLLAHFDQCRVQFTVIRRDLLLSKREQGISMHSEIVSLTKLTGYQLQRVSKIAQQAHAITGRIVQLRDPELFIKLEIIVRQGPDNPVRDELLDRLHALAEELRDNGAICQQSNLVIEDYRELGLCVSYIGPQAA